MTIENIKRATELVARLEHIDELFERKQREIRITFGDYSIPLRFELGTLHAKILKLINEERDNIMEEIEGL